ncbi:MAG: winged helix-turn-helix transcriptional regulator [Thermodesulfobacteriota bacterium]
MEKEARTTLQILEILEADDRVSQRELARRLSVSLGLVNQFMKRLLRKGYFKITTLPANRVRYLLTPKGLAEKGRLTADYLRYSLQFFAQARGLIRDSLAAMEAAGVEHCILAGTGEVAELVYLFLQETRIILVGVVDDTASGSSFYGRPVRPLAELGTLPDGAVLVASLDGRATWRQQLAAASQRSRPVYFLMRGDSTVGEQDRHGHHEPAA